MALSSPQYARFVHGTHQEYYLGILHLEEVIKSNDVEGLREFLVLKPGLLDWKDEISRIPRPILLACELGYDEVLNVLLDYQETLPSTPNHPRENDDNGYTWAAYGSPFITSCAFGRLSTVNLLLTRHPQIDLEDRSSGERTPLLAAVNTNEPWSEDREEIVRLLLERGACATATSPLAHSAHPGKPNCWTALALAMKAGKPQAIRSLVEAGAEIHGFSWRTPLFVGSFYGNAAAVHTLLALGARSDIITPDIQGSLPLHAALTGPEVTRPEGLAWAWHWQVSDPALRAIDRAVDIITALLSDDKDRESTVNATDGQGRTPLQLAARFDKVPVMRLLLGHGANPLVLDPDGRAALHVLLGSVRRLYSPELRAEIDDKSLMENDIDEDLIRHLVEEVSENSNQPHARVNITRTSIVNQPDLEGNTPLHYAAKGWLERATGSLLNLGARADICNNAGETPLHLAANMAEIGEEEGLEAYEDMKAEQDRVLTLLTREGSGGDMAARNGAGITAAQIVEEDRAKRLREAQWGAKVRQLRVARLREIARIESLPPERQWAEWTASKWRGMNREGDGFRDWQPSVSAPPGMDPITRMGFGRGQVLTWASMYHERDLESELAK